MPLIMTRATMVGTTRATLSRVLHKLESEGIVTARHGWGTFVAQAPEGHPGPIGPWRAVATSMRLWPDSLESSSLRTQATVYDRN
jgi:DNA-binding FadR family transcriptional regulator